MIGHAKYFDSNMAMSFKVSYEKLLKCIPNYGQKSSV